MSEYITKETAIRILHEASYLSDGSLIEVSGYIAEEMIKDEPPADVFQLIRCKQCGWSMESREVPGMYMCKNDDAVDNYVRPEFACILAERREG